MKKIILIALLHLSIMPIIKAQITITQADFSLTSQAYTSLRDTSSFISPGNAGANQTWDFSSFTSGTTQSYTQDFGANNAHPEFPNANSTPCVMNGPMELCAYYEIIATGMYHHGSTFNIDMTAPNYFRGTVTYTPPVPEYSFPLTYGTVDSMGFLQEQLNVSNPPQSGADSVLIRSHNTRKVEADGWGTLITPLGTYNALRLKITETEIDTQWVHIPGSGWQVEYEHVMSGPFVSYQWLANGNSAVVALLREDNQSWRYNFITTGTTAPQTPAAPTNLTTTVFKTQDVNIRVEWTDNANNEDGFKVERSEDGTSFTEIADLAANTVQYEDLQLSENTTYYYRVLAYNTNGASLFSNIAQATTGISTGIDEKISAIKVYPNPASEYFTIEIKGKEMLSGTRLNLMNAVGQIIKEVAVNASTTNIGLSDIPSGYYFYQIISQQEVLHFGKFVKN